MWVAELPQDLDLGLERLQILLVAERVVLHDLDRVFGSLLFVRGGLHHGEASSAQLIAKLVDRRDILHRHVGQGSDPLVGVHLDLHADQVSDLRHRCTQHRAHLNSGGAALAGRLATIIIIIIAH